MTLHSDDSDRQRHVRFLATFGPVKQRITLRDSRLEVPDYSHCELVDAKIPRFINPKRERFDLNLASELWGYYTADVISVQPLTREVIRPATCHVLSGAATRGQTHGS